MLTALPYLRAKFEDFAAGVKARWPAGQDGPPAPVVETLPEPGSGKVGLGLATLGKLAKICKFLAGSFSAVQVTARVPKHAPLTCP